MAIDLTDKPCLFVFYPAEPPTPSRHAVICDGAAMQRVPGSLRCVTKICREAGIPLYIINDPRSWGSQTHSALSDALDDMQTTITDNVVSNPCFIINDEFFLTIRLTFMILTVCRLVMHLI